MLTKDYMYFTSKLVQIFYTHQKPKRPGQKERPMYHIGTNQTIHAQKWYLSKQPKGTGYTHKPSSCKGSHGQTIPLLRLFGLDNPSWDFCISTRPCTATFIG